jgi:hypothetical protein
VRAAGRPAARNPRAVVVGFDGPCERYGLDDADRFVEVDAGRLLANINRPWCPRAPGPWPI